MNGSLPHEIQVAPTSTYFAMRSSAVILPIMNVPQYAPRNNYSYMNIPYTNQPVNSFNGNSQFQSPILMSFCSPSCRHSHTYGFQTYARESTGRHFGNSSTWIEAISLYSVIHNVCVGGGCVEAYI